MVVENNEILDEIIKMFEPYLSFEEEVVSKIDLKSTHLPKEAVIIPNFNLGFNVKVEDVYVDMDLRVKKMSGF